MIRWYLYQRISYQCVYLMMFSSPDEAPLLSSRTHNGWAQEHVASECMVTCHYKIHNVVVDLVAQHREILTLWTHSWTLVGTTCVIQILTITLNHLNHIWLTNGCQLISMWAELNTVHMISSCIWYYYRSISSAVLHHLHARFITHFLNDAGYIKHNEPFKRLVNQVITNSLYDTIPFHHVLGNGDDEDIQNDWIRSIPATRGGRQDDERW